MSFYLVSACIFLFLVNFVLILKSKRKKKYGIYPGVVALVLAVAVTVFSLYAGASLHHPGTLPHSPGRSRQEEKIYLSEARLEVLRKEDGDRLKSLIPVYHFLINLMKVQLVVSLLFGIWGLILTSGRTKFYTLIIILYACCIPGLFLLDVSLCNLIFQV
ncbi:MAG: hypothetical protein ACHQRM_05480 [Bacteroidia bacterium]